MFLLCWAGRDHTDAVELHVACIRADDSDHNVSIANTEENRNGTNSERELKEKRRRRRGRKKKGREGWKDSWFQDCCWLRMTKWCVDKRQIRGLWDKDEKGKYQQDSVCSSKVQDLWFHFSLKWSMKITPCDMHEFTHWMGKIQSGAPSLQRKTHRPHWLAQPHDTVWV